MIRNSNILFITNPQWASSEIRGTQIVSELGCHINKEQIPESVDTIVFVKTMPNDESKRFLEKSGHRLIFDLVDSSAGIVEVARIPNAEAIAIGMSAYNYVKARLPLNKVWLIPEFHVQYELKNIELKKVKTAGFIGYSDNLTLDIDDLRMRLGDIGIDFLTCFDFKTEQDVIDFYLSIDLQLCYRLPNLHPIMPPEMKNPLKLVNAGAFGIPTIAFPEIGYTAEWIPGVDFIQATSPKQLVTEACGLVANPNKYMVYRCNAYRKSQEYKKQYILGLYKKMLGVK